jgi:hypothetical protein
MKLLLAITLVVAATLCHGQTAFETLVTYKGRKVQFVPVITYPAFEVENVLKTKWTAEVRAFAGSRIDQETELTFGGIAAFRFPDAIGKGIDASLGFFARATQGAPCSAGFYAAISRRF